MSAWGKIHSSRMSEWIEAYHSAGVKNEVNPSSQEMVCKLKHNFIVCSDLARSLHSAEMIGYPSPNLVDSLFREAELTSIVIPVIRLTPHAWSMAFRVFWFAGVSSKAESLDAFKPRACLAAEKLIQLAKDHESVCSLVMALLIVFWQKNLFPKVGQAKKLPMETNIGAISIGNMQHTQKLDNF